MLVKFKIKDIFYWFTVLAIPLFFLRVQIISVFNIAIKNWNSHYFLQWFNHIYWFFGYEGYKVKPDTDFILCDGLGFLCAFIFNFILIFIFLLFTFYFRSLLYPEEFKCYTGKKE